MSFGLVVLAVDPGATDIAVRAMAECCQSLHHPEGELDERIVGCYENLRARYADFPPYAHDSPWQGDEVTRPTDVRTPVDPAIVALIEELRAPDC